MIPAAGRLFSQPRRGPQGLSRSVTGNSFITIERRKPTQSLPRNQIMRVAQGNAGRHESTTVLRRIPRHVMDMPAEILPVTVQRSLRTMKSAPTASRSKASPSTSGKINRLSRLKNRRRPKDDISPLANVSPRWKLCTGLPDDKKGQPFLKDGAGHLCVSSQAKAGARISARWCWKFIRWKTRAHGQGSGPPKQPPPSQFGQGTPVPAQEVTA